MGLFAAFLIALGTIGGCHTQETICTSDYVDTTDNNTGGDLDTDSDVDSDTDSDSDSDSDSDTDTNSDTEGTIDLVQHLDATALGSVLTDESGVVTEWRDLSSHGHHATPTRGKVMYPSADLSTSGLAGLDFGLDQNELELLDAAETSALLDFTQNGGAAAKNSGFTLFVAFRIAETTENTQYVLGTRNLLGHFSVKITNDHKLAFALLNNTTVSGSLNVAPGDTIVAGVSYEAATGKSRLWESKNDLVAEEQQTAFGDWDADVSLQLGDARHQDDTISCFRGMVGEVKIFSSALSRGDFDAEREALASKWLTSTKGGSDIDGGT